MMRNISFLFSAAFAISLSVVTTSVIYADQENSSPDLGGGFIESKPWQESEVVFPAYPKADDMLKVEVDRINMPFNVYVDEKSFTVLPDDGVVRYTVVIQSVSGANNVLYEGIRCRAGQYRTYAYGTYDKKFSEAITSEWKNIKENEFMVHRDNFLSYYMCSERGELYPVEEMLSRIKYPSDFQDSGDMSD